jgi:hypothetical protein
MTLQSIDCKESQASPNGTHIHPQNAISANNKLEESTRLDKLRGGALFNTFGLLDVRKALLTKTCTGRELVIDLGLIRTIHAGMTHNSQTIKFNEFRSVRNQASLEVELITIGVLVRCFLRIISLIL